MTDLNEAQILTIVKNTVEHHDRKSVEIDLENKVLNLEGFEESKVKCAMELAKVLG